MNIYFAAPLFTAAERAFNEQLATEICHNSTSKVNPIIWLPQQSSASGTGDIYEQNMTDIRACDLLLAIVDGADVDSGTAFEIGFAHAIGKRVWLVRTDFREGGDDAHFQINLMLTHSASKLLDYNSKVYTVREIAQAIAQELQDYVHG